MNIILNYIDDYKKEWFDCTTENKVYIHMLTAFFIISYIISMSCLVFNIQISNAYLFGVVVNFLGVGIFYITFKEKDIDNNYNYYSMSMLLTWLPFSFILYSIIQIKNKITSYGA